MRRNVLSLFFFCVLLSPVGLGALSSPAAPTSSLSRPCPRYAAGGTLVEPKDLFSSHGVLAVGLTYETRIDEYGNVLYCFTSDDGSQSPTLHVSPGDELLITLKNALPLSMTPSFHKHAMAAMSSLPAFGISGQTHQASPNCGGMVMTDTSTNLHYHGTNTPPTCHQDEVIKTLINSGETFQYDLHFPLDEPRDFTGTTRTSTGSLKPQCRGALRVPSSSRA